MHSGVGVGWLLGMAASGAEVSGPIDQPWNVREATILDPDGYKLVFTAPINLSAKFDEVMERTKNSL